MGLGRTSQQLQPITASAASQPDPEVKFLGQVADIPERSPKSPHADFY